MTSITQEYLKKHYSVKEVANFETVERKPLLICKDGYSISVQASEYHYCTPRTNLEDGCYYEVELGFPNQFDELINSYAEDKDSIETVFPYVPIELVDELIIKHGGIK